MFWCGRWIKNGGPPPSNMFELYKVHAPPVAPSSPRQLGFVAIYLAFVTAIPSPFRRQLDLHQLHHPHPHPPNIQGHFAVASRLEHFCMCSHSLGRPSARTRVTKTLETRHITTPCLVDKSSNICPRIFIESHPVDNKKVRLNRVSRPQNGRLEFLPIHD